MVIVVKCGENERERQEERPTRAVPLTLPMPVNEGYDKVFLQSYRVRTGLNNCGNKVALRGAFHKPPGMYVHSDESPVLQR